MPSVIRDAQRPTEHDNFDLAGGRWFARAETKHTKVVQLMGHEERVAVDGTRNPLRAGIHCILLRL